MSAKSSIPVRWRDGVPYNDHRQAFEQRTCKWCRAEFYAVRSNVARGGGAFCAPACASSWFVANETFKGDKNPRWLGGVSTDNMRYRRRQRERHPKQEAARKAVADAIRRGEIARQPCEKCGAAKAQAHHDDYDKPLDVRWLCRLHHDEHHAQERRLARIKRVEAKRP